MAVMVMVVVSEFKGCSVGRGMQFNKKKKKEQSFLETLPSLAAWIMIMMLL